MGVAVDNAIASVAAANGYAQTYVNFTTKLVTDVMNALVSSSISQMKAFADLVAQLELGLSAFKASTCPTPSIISWIEKNIPEAGTNPALLTASGAPLSQASANTIINLYSSKLVTVLGPPPKGGKYVLPKSDITKLTDPATKFDATDLESGGKLDGTTAVDYTDPATPISGAPTSGNDTQIDLCSAVKTMFAQEAINSYKQLDHLVQMGMTRIVITDGHILTKMTFEMTATDAAQTSQFDAQSQSTSVGLTVGGGMPWLHASASVSHSEFSCKVASEHSQVSDTIHATMMGEVLVNYKSDYFPALPSQAKP